MTLPHEFDVYVNGSVISAISPVDLDNTDSRTLIVDNSIADSSDIEETFIRMDRHVEIRRRH
ncbi:hypothetical protein LV28_08670 [Pandoraea pnomenusa]|nr:hypothetical protein X636_04865 [Pandoraea pnomenusa]AIU26604.1 hypothetical protein LV28_08670 [Pandoraea pnomenusa]